MKSWPSPPVLETAGPSLPPSCRAPSLCGTASTASWTTPLPNAPSAISPASSSTPASMKPPRVSAPTSSPSVLAQTCYPALHPSSSHPKRTTTSASAPTCPSLAPTTPSKRSLKSIPSTLSSTPPAAANFLSPGSFNVSLSGVSPHQAMLFARAKSDHWTMLKT